MPIAQRRAKRALDPAAATGKIERRGSRAALRYRVTCRRNVGQCCSSGQQALPRRAVAKRQSPAAGSAAAARSGGALIKYSQIRQSQRARHSGPDINHLVGLDKGPDVSSVMDKVFPPGSAAGQGQ